MKLQPALLLALSLAPAAFVATVARADAPAAKPAPAAPAPIKGADAEGKTIPAQSEVAAKAAFATVAPNDKAVTAALDAKAFAAALKLVGKPGSFQGTVSKVYSPASHAVTILDFAPNYRDALAATLKPDDYAKYPDLNGLVGKRVLVSGKFTANAHGVAQLEMTGPDQVKVIQ